MSSVMRRRRIAGGPDDFLSAIHLSLRGTEYDIGRALADEARTHCNWRPPPAADPTRNRARRKWFERNWPAHYERMNGAAGIFGHGIDDDHIDFGNVMAEPTVPGCSAVWCPSRASANGHALVSRNMDFSTRTVSEMLGGLSLPGEPPALSRPYLIETHPSEGHATIVSAVGDLTGCLDGMNDQGLVAAMLADDESSGLQPSATPQAGLNETHLLRYILETCASAEEAKEALFGVKQYDEYAVAHYLIADSDQAFVWERDMHNAEHVVPASSDSLCVTNFLLHGLGADGVPGESPGRPSANDAYRRSRRLQSGLDGSPITSKSLWFLLESVRADARNDEEFPEQQTRTIWHNQYDLARRSVEIVFYLGEDPQGSSRLSQRVTLSLGEDPGRLP